MVRAIKFLNLNLWALIVIFLACAQPTLGQSQITASIGGTVLDSSGQSAGQARVTIFNADRAITRTYTTEENGFFSFTLLPPATYLLEVEATGFKQAKQEGVTLAAGQTANLNINLVIGAVTETVEVSSQAPLLNSENANIASDISSRQVSELPLNLRNVIGLAVLNSSVSNAAAMIGSAAFLFPEGSMAPRRRWPPSTMY